METLDKSALFEQTIHVDWAFVRGALPKESGKTERKFYPLTFFQAAENEQLEENQKKRPTNFLTFRLIS